MPFGMVNSGATLVRGLKKVLKGLSGVVYNDSWEKHLRTIKKSCLAAELGSQPDIQKKKRAFCFNAGRSRAK